MSLATALRTGVCGLALSALMAGAALSDPFTGLAKGFEGQMIAEGLNRAPITAGSTAEIRGKGFAPGQSVVLRQNGVALNEGAPIVADAEGAFSTEITIPEGAEPGLYPVVAEIADPAFAMTVDLKVSPVLPESGGLSVTSQKLASGLYQVAQTPDALYVTSAVGRPPVTESKLMKLDPSTLEVLAEVTPADAPDGDNGRDGGVFAVYGVGVDVAQGQVWVTNTRQNTVAVYSADDLSLIKQFEPGAVPHPRDALVLDGKVYVSATFEPVIHVFDSATLEELAPIELSSGKRGERFGTASMDIDAESATLVVVSLTTDEVATVDLGTGTQTSVHALPLSKRTIGVAYDAEDGLIFTTGMNTDNLLILDAKTGEALHDVPVGSGPLNVTYDAVNDLAWVAVRGSDSLVAVSPEGDVVAKTEIGSYPNHLTTAEDGGVFVVNKARGAEDESGDHISHVTPGS
ncbi:YncE family protein [Salipiger sp. PrR002]|uniref:YncE family protein n=1 Tax=Salipiger sp. PrR002 TaxID=2706489 RepID=UPI0013BBFEED|nr:ATP-binding protein [Salipiger sp. PrR002]NDV99934.1 ATP-binding protein [Salipiger sp. PrR002]NDW56273.1 ATP-binding protein [Salipiger sp. PrR004]